MIPARDQENPPSFYNWLILVGLIMAAVMEVLDTTIVNVSLPQIAGNLGSTSEEIGWISTGYILSNVIVLPMTAWLSSRFGRRNYLSGSILIFVAASVMCGMSHSLGALVFWRIIQGAGGAALLSTAQATIREIFPKEQQSLVQAIYMLGIIVAPTLGPTLGGWITDNFSWNWVFLINLPIGLISFFLVWSFLQDSKFAMKITQIDWTGIVLLAIGLGSLQYLLEEGNSKDWFDDATIQILALVSGIILPIFGWWQMSPKNPSPIVNLKVLQNRDLAVGLILFVVLGFGLYGGVFIYPMFAQNVMHLTPTETGLTLLPGGIMTGFAALMCGRLLGGAKPKFEPKIAIVCGLGIYLISVSFLAQMPSTAGSANIVVPLLLRGMGLGMLFIPINLAAFASLEGVQIAQGAGLLNLSRQLGGSFGIALIGSFVTRQLLTARASLVENINTANPAVIQRLQLANSFLSVKGIPPNKVQQASYALLDQSVMIQAATKAYNGGFMLILVASVLASPTILLLRSGKKRGAPAGGPPPDAH